MVKRLAINFEPSIWGKKRYFLPLGTTPKTGVGFIVEKITEHH